MRLKHVFLMLLFVVIAGLIVKSANAETENFTVPPETDFTKSLNLRENDRVSIGFSVVGETTHEIDFYIIDPDEDIIYPYYDRGHLSFSFLTTKAGAYTLHFDNIQSTETKMVTLNYDVEHYIFGMPETMFLTIIIIIICVLAVATFILLGKPG